MNCANRYDKKLILIITGLIIMALISLTKIISSTSIAGYSVFVGIAFFFIVEAVCKTPQNESGLQFKSFISDLKKPWVLFLVLLPIVTSIATLVIGDLIFSGKFSAHIIGRTDSMLSFNKIPLLIFQVIIAALGEEIAWRGFFVGKGMKILPFWLCAIVSSVLFSVGHISSGSFALVFYDISTIFIDSLIYALVYKKSQNCLISTAAHILCNAAGITFTLLFL